VLETGLGGRLDSTNVVESDISVITSIGLEHTRILGSTKELIGEIGRGAKAGAKRQQTHYAVFVHNL